MNYFIYYYPTVSFTPTLVEGNELHGFSAGGIVLVTLIFVLAVSNHAQYLVAVQPAIATFKAFADVIVFLPLPYLPPFLIITNRSFLNSSERARMVVSCVAMVEDCLELVATS